MVITRRCRYSSACGAWCCACSTWGWRSASSSPLAHCSGIRCGRFSTIAPPSRIGSSRRHAIGVIAPTRCSAIRTISVAGVTCARYSTTPVRRPGTASSGPS
uniref:Putative secreted protein n=1 Tax=Anopheles marajoara TaxID=58244 RepID=A0A2M4C8L7_9DIPT